MNDLVISEGTRVTLNFALILEDGSEVDTNFDGAPASFSVDPCVSRGPGLLRAEYGRGSGQQQAALSGCAVFNAVAR